MKETKKTKKAIKPKFIVDMTTAETPGDVADAFILAKVNAGMPISTAELICAKYNAIDRVMEELKELTSEFAERVNVVEDDDLVKDIINLVNAKLNKKTPWYKRFWKWLKKPFTKKK